MPFVCGRFGPSASPILLPRKGISALRHAYHAKIIGGSRLIYLALVARSRGGLVSRTWLSIRVDLVSGRGHDYWPRPGRMFAAARSHTFAHFATAIDDAFARWDRAHLHLFNLGDGDEGGGSDPAPAA